VAVSTDALFEGVEVSQNISVACCHVRKVSKKQKEMSVLLVVMKERLFKRSKKKYWSACHHVRKDKSEAKR
jgi:hypothetical protein